MTVEQTKLRHLQHGPWPMDHCGYCARDRNHCRRKIRFDTWAEADQWIRELNETRSYTEPVVRYRCRWCDGYHMCRAKRSEQRARARRQERKWLIQKETERRRAGGGDPPQRQLP